MWGTDALALMRSGLPAAEAVARVTTPDTGKAERQMSALDLTGATAHFTGGNSIAVAGAREAAGVVVAGNLLASEAVLDACLEGFLTATGGLDERLLTALETASRAGGDSRGLLSAALLVVSRSTPPLTLRVDYSEAPLSALRVLHGHATNGLYADWLHHVPVTDDPHRALPFASTELPIGET
ncbi:hypothetical protein SSE37_20482 [Sagittula stellata E-37]|uniref:Major pilin protein fimA n=2 Tax=Sagittula stellata TaxID=52603 RepID=A3JY34_SAGS3|nr:hypothetical protein SSE37_20482 [Sagittula stellata E-37]